MLGVICRVNYIKQETECVKIGELYKIPNMRGTSDDDFNNENVHAVGGANANVADAVVEESNVQAVGGANANVADAVAEESNVPAVGGAYANVADAVAEELIVQAVGLVQFC